MQPPDTRRLLPIWMLGLTLVGIVLLVLFALESTPMAVVDLSTTRADAGQIASRWLSEKGIDSKAFWSTTSFQFESDAQSYILREEGREQLEHRAATDLNLAAWRVRFWQPLQPEQWEILVSPRTGRINGFRHTIRAEAAGATLSITQAQSLALQALSVPESELLLLERASITQPERVDHRFVWQKPALNVGEAQYRYAVVVQGDQVGSLNEYYWLPDAWAREGAWQARRGGLLATIGWAFTALMTALVGFTWLVEAQKRSLHRRWAWTLWLAGVAVGLLVMLNSLPLELAAYDVNQSLPGFLFERLFGYVVQLATLTITIVFAGTVGEALVWERSGGALLMSRSLTKAGLVSRPVVQALLIGVLMGVTQLGFVSAFYALGGRWFGVWSPVQSLYDDTLSTPFPPLYGLAIGLLPAVGEELMFRLGGISVLTRWTGKPRLAVVVTAIAWASLHATYPQRPFFIRMLELSLVGIVFGFLFIRYGVLASMAAHFTYNASLYVPLFWSGPLWLLIAAIIAAGSMALLLIPALIRRLRGHDLNPDAVLAAPLTEPLLEPSLPTPEPLPLLNRRWVAALVAVLLLALVVIGWNLPRMLVRDGTQFGAITAAQTAAQRLGIALDGLNPSVAPLADWSDLDTEYLRETLPSSEAERVLATAHPRAWSVRWSAWDRPDSWQIDLGPAGEVLAYRWTVPEDMAGPTLPISEAETLAYATFAVHVPIPNDYTLINASTSQRTARTDHSFTWQTREPTLGEAHRRVSIDVIGDRIATVVPSLYTPPEFRREREQTTLLESILRFGPPLMVVLAMFLLMTLGVVGIARRTTSWRPWVRLGIVAAVLEFVIACLAINTAQLREIPRLLVVISWGLNSAAYAGGSIALLAAGAAVCLRAIPDLRPLETLGTDGQRWIERLMVISIVALATLVWLNASMWPNPPIGDFAAAGILGSWLPAVSIGASTAVQMAQMLLVALGMWGLLGRWLPVRVALGSVLVGVLATLGPLDEPRYLLLVAIAYLPVLGIAWFVRQQFLNTWIGLWLGSIIVQGVNLWQTNTAWYSAQAALLVAICSLGWLKMVQSTRAYRIP